MIETIELENQLDRLSEQALVFEDEVDQWTQWQPDIAAYILSDDFSLLTEVERETLLFGATLLLTVARENGLATEPISEETIGELDEANWTWLEESEGRSLSDKMDVLFDQYPEPELLAFIEDLCTDEEEEDLTRSGGEIMVVALKTVADALFLKTSMSS
jgi:hypothetical protein